MRYSIYLLLVQFGWYVKAPSIFRLSLKHHNNYYAPESQII
jgi:hypothetical protein